MPFNQKKNLFDFKTQYCLGFNQQDYEIVVDFFCGGGGGGAAGTGLEMGLVRAVTVAKNHSPAAISMHTANHPADPAMGAAVAKRCKSTGRIIKLGGRIAEPSEVVPVSEQFLVPDSKRRGQT